MSDTRVVDHLYHLDREAFKMLLSACMSSVPSDREIARQHHKACAPRVMVRRNGMLRSRKPSVIYMPPGGG